MEQIIIYQILRYDYLKKNDYAFGTFSKRRGGNKSSKQINYLGNHHISAIGFGFASNWLKKWCETFEPITKRSKRNHVISFDSQLKIRPNSKVNRNSYHRQRL